MDEYIEQCEVCGEDLTGGLEHEHEAIIIRDGARGQYLAPTFVLDVADLVGIDKVPADVRAAAAAWLDQMGARGIDVQDFDAELVLDWVSTRASSLLADAGYTDISDDGYVIYKI